MSPRQRQVFRLLVASMTFLLVGAMMNPTAVRDWANGQPNGWRRDVAVDLTEPIVDFSDRLGIDEPRRAAADLLDWTPTVSTLPPRVAPGVATTSTTSVPDVPGSTVPPPPTTTTIPTRLATIDDPLRILTLGDSMMVDLQPAIDRLLVRQGMARNDGHGAFFLGLTSSQTGYLEENLNPEWARYVAEGNPDVVVVLLGAADFDEWAPAGETLVSGSPEWEAWIARRANDVIGILTAGGAHVYWMTTPLMEPAKFAAVPTIHDIWYGLEATWPGWVTVLNSMESLGDAEGNYQRYLNTDDGSIQQLRQDDGVHFLPVGADRLAAQLAQTLVDDGWLPPTVVAPG